MRKPPKTYKAIQAEIKRLSAQAEKARARERREVIGRIRVAIDAYGLTVADLGLSASSARRGQSVASVAAPARTVPGKLPPKYADGNGNQWTGRGPRPRWLITALAEGRSQEDLLVK